MGCPQPQPALRRRFPYPRTRLRRFGLSNPAIRLLGLSPCPSEKKPKFGIGVGLLSEKGCFPCFPGCFRLSANHFQSIGNLCPFTFRFDAPRPPAPAHIRNMLRRRAGAGGWGAFEKPVVFFLTTVVFSLTIRCIFLDKKRVPIKSFPLISISRHCRQTVSRKPCLFSLQTSKQAPKIM